MKIFITGATGLFGSYLAREFSKCGEIHALIRPGSSKRLTEDFDFPVVWHVGDLLDQDFIEEILGGFDLVIHAAGLVSYNEKDETMLYQINVKGTASLVNAVLLSGVKQLIHVSSVAAIGRGSELQDVDENFKWTDSPLNTAYANSKYYGELEAWRGEQEGLNLIVINPSVLLGKVSDDRSSTDIYHYLLEKNSYYPVGAINYIDVRDAAILTRYLFEEGAWGERFILNREALAYRDFFQTMGKAFGISAPTKAINSNLLGFVVFFNEVFRKIGLSKSPLNKKTAKIAQQKIFFDNKKILQLLNYQYRDLAATFSWAK
jgi:nucleoside-diphosphate-sugar epimerase